MPGAEPAIRGGAVANGRGQTARSVAYASQRRSTTGDKERSKRKQLAASPFLRPYAPPPYLAAFRFKLLRNRPSASPSLPRATLIAVPSGFRSRAVPDE